MNVENNYTIAIAAFSDWLKNLAPVFQPVTSKVKTNYTMFAHFPALSASYGKLIGTCSDWFIALFVSGAISRRNYWARFIWAKIPV